MAIRTKPKAKYRISAGKLALRRVERSLPFRELKPRGGYGYETRMCMVTFGADTVRLSALRPIDVLGMPHVYVWTPIWRTTSSMGLMQELQGRSWAEMAFGMHQLLNIRAEVGFGLTDGRSSV